MRQEGVRSRSSPPILRNNPRFSGVVRELLIRSERVAVIAAWRANQCQTSVRNVNGGDARFLESGARATGIPSCGSAQSKNNARLARGCLPLGVLSRESAEGGSGESCDLPVRRYTRPGSATARDFGPRATPARKHRRPTAGER